MTQPVRMLGSRFRTCSSASMLAELTTHSDTASCSCRIWTTRSASLYGAPSVLSSMFSLILPSGEGHDVGQQRNTFVSELGREPASCIERSDLLIGEFG